MKAGVKPSMAQLKQATIKSIAIIFSFSASALPSYAESYTAQRAGQGFTDITQDFTSSLSNPALLTKFDDDDDLYFSINLGGLGSDQFNVLDIATDINDNLDQLVDDINAIEDKNFQSVEEAQLYYDDLDEQVNIIVEDFMAIDKKIVKATNGLNFQIIIPNEHLSLGIYANQHGRYGGFMDYSEGDEETLNNAILKGELSLDELNSATLVVGYSIAEVGVMGAYPIIEHSAYDFSIGAKVKYQRVDLYYNRASAADFDDDYDLTDEEFITDESDMNADLGLYLAWGDDRQWSAALVTNNLMGQTVVHAEQNITFNLDSTTSFGLGYEASWISLAAEVDLTDRETFANLTPSKYAGVGAEFRAGKHLQFRVGYRMDQNEVDEDIYTLGLGVSPGDVLALDIAAFTGDNDTIGAAIQLSLKI